MAQSNHGTDAAVFDPGGGAIPSGAATSTNQTATQAPVAPGAATATKSELSGGQYNSSGVTLTDGQQSATQFDAKGSTRVLNVDGTGATIDYTAVVTTAVQEKQTFGAAFTALAPAVAATDIVAIGGSATKIIRIRRIQVSGVATAAGAYSVLFIKRSTADTGGTSTAATIVPFDSTNSAGTGTALGYTANPTVGTPVGTTGYVAVRKITVSTAAGAIPIVVNEFDFGTDGNQSIVLRGTAEQLCINLAATTMTGGLLDITVRWTEE